VIRGASLPFGVSRSLSIEAGRSVFSAEAGRSVFSAEAGHSAFSAFLKVSFT